MYFLTRTARQILRTLFLLSIALLLLSTRLEAAAEDPVVDVYFLVGQSNMEGKGNPVHLDTYKEDPLIKPTYAGLKDGDEWAVRNDVWITYPTKFRGAKHGPLTVGYGTKGVDSIGPEFGFGHTIGNATERPVVLIKIAWGGKSVAVDFRPPGVPPTDEEIDELLERAQKRKPETTRDEIVDRFGHYYRETVKHATNELQRIGERFPQLKDHKPNIAGFIWHQGFNDLVDRGQKDEQFSGYATRLTQFIKDIRRDLNAPKMPFVIGELSTGGIPNRGDFQAAQRAVASRPEFAGTVAFVPTAEYYDTKAHELFEKGYWKGTDEQKAQWEAVGNDRPYHYLGSGKTYYLKGVAFAHAALELNK